MSRLFVVFRIVAGEGVEKWNVLTCLMRPIPDVSLGVHTKCVHGD
jgi:hypothetical protein